MQILWKTWIITIGVVWLKQKLSLKWCYWNYLSFFGRKSKIDSKQVLLDDRTGNTLTRRISLFTELLKRQEENTNDFIHPSCLFQVSPVNNLGCLSQVTHRQNRAKVWRKILWVLSILKEMCPVLKIPHSTAITHVQVRKTPPLPQQNPLSYVVHWMMEQNPCAAQGAAEVPQRRGKSTGGFF